MVYSFYKASVDNGTVYDVEDVIAVTLHHNQMGHFLHRWDRVGLGLAEPMPENTKKAFFCSKVRGCIAFQFELLNWKRLSDDVPKKTLETLRAAMKTIIEDARGEKFREDVLRGHAGGGRGRQPTPAYPANQENNTVAPHTDAPAPSGGGGGGGRGRSRGGNTQRSAT